MNRKRKSGAMPFVHFLVVIYTLLRWKRKKYNQRIKGIVMSKEDNEIKTLIQTMVYAMVERPDLVLIEICDVNHMIYIRIGADMREAGKLIGKNGRNVEALRTILRAAASKEKKRVFLEITNDNWSNDIEKRNSEVIYLHKK